MKRTQGEAMLILLIRWRWLMTVLMALQIFELVHHYKVRDVTGWPLLPSAWVLPWLTLGCVGVCVLTATVWTAYLYRLRPSVSV